MSEKSKIQWTDTTWNPIRARRIDGTGKIGWACVRVSPGCVNCYAATQNKRAFWGGTGLDYTVPDLAKVETYVDLKTLLKPLSWRSSRRVFVCSMTDLFGDWVSDIELDQIFGVMSACSYIGNDGLPGHTFQVLTKRPERMRAYLSSDRRAAVASHAAQYGGGDDADAIYDQARRQWPAFPHVWLGTSVENQRAAAVRIPELLGTPGAVRFLSCEPLLGPVDLTKVVLRDGDGLGAGLNNLGLDTSLDWVIVGGESGNKARGMDIAWARSLVAQCSTARVPVFVKQLGARPYETKTQAGFPIAAPWWIKDRKGGEPSEWPEDLRVREWPR